MYFPVIAKDVTAFKITSGVINFKANIIGSVGQVSVGQVKDPAGKAVGKVAPANAQGACGAQAKACVADSKCVNAFLAAMKCEASGASSLAACLEGASPAIINRAQPRESKSGSYTLLQNCMTNTQAMFKKALLPSSAVDALSASTDVKQIQLTKKALPSARRLASAGSDSGSSKAYVLFSSNGNGEGAATSSSNNAGAAFDSDAFKVYASTSGDGSAGDGGARTVNGVLVGALCAGLVVVGAVGTAYKKNAGPFARKNAETTAQAVDGKIGNPLSPTDLVGDDQTDVL